MAAILILAALFSSFCLPAWGVRVGVDCVSGGSPFSAFLFFTLATVMILQRVSSESELLLPPESVWIFLVVSFFCEQSLETAKCPVFLQALQDLPLAKQLSPPVHFQMPHLSQLFSLAPSVLSFFP
jgi:hypothetical protein